MNNFNVTINKLETYSFNDNHVTDYWQETQMTSAVSHIKYQLINHNQYSCNHATETN